MDWGSLIGKINEHGLKTFLSRWFFKKCLVDIVVKCTLMWNMHL